MIYTAFVVATALSSAQPAAEAPNSPQDRQAAEQPVLELSKLPIEQAAAPRCGIAFALVSRWQKAGDSRGSEWPDMEADGGREFFVRSMATLMETQQIDRGNLTKMVVREIELLEGEGEEQVEAMMPACMLMKQGAGL